MEGRWKAGLLALLLWLSGCAQAEGTSAVQRECWCGTVAALFSEGGGSDRAEVLALETEEQGIVCFTLEAGTLYSRSDPTTGAEETLTREELYVGARVELDCRAEQSSARRPVLALRLIGGDIPLPEDSAAAAETAAAYANWSDAPEITACARNAEQLATSRQRHLPVYCFSSPEELQQFQQRFGGVLTMDQGYGDIPSFREAAAGYDADFFRENSLLLAYVTAGSGSLRFAVKSVDTEDGILCLHAEQLNAPQVMTMDMAGWFLLAAVPRSLAERCAGFDAVLDPLPAAQAAPQAAPNAG